MLSRIRSGFTLLEVVFAIMILGIVASISSEIILQVYSAYLQQRTVHNASIKTELAINQLANRLAYRIDRSVTARQPGRTGNTFANDIYPLREVPSTAMNSHIILEWIGYDNDTFSTSDKPAWSGYCDTLSSSYNTLSTPGSYGNNDGALSKILAYYGAGNGAIVFAGREDYRTDGAGFYGGTYSANCMYDTGGTGCIFPVTNLGAGTATFTGNSDRTNGRMIYTEFYRYAVSAFAVEPVATRTLPNGGIQLYDLHLHYGYQPWEGENYLSNPNNDSVLLRNVSVFRFIKETNNIRIKLCVVEEVGNGTDDHFSICKEKAVIR